MSDDEVRKAVEGLGRWQLQWSPHPWGLGGQAQEISKSFDFAFVRGCDLVHGGLFGRHRRLEATPSPATGEPMEGSNVSFTTWMSIVGSPNSIQRREEIRRPVPQVETALFEVSRPALIQRCRRLRAIKRSSRIDPRYGQLRSKRRRMGPGRVPEDLEGAEIWQGVVGPNVDAWRRHISSCAGRQTRAPTTPSLRCPRVFISHRQKTSSWRGGLRGWRRRRFQFWLDDLDPHLALVPL